MAADPSTPSTALAARALAWHEHIHYGLWRIEDPVLAPGLRCTDIVSGTSGTSSSRRSNRWTAAMDGVAGGIVLVDGLAQHRGRVRLSPAEADAAAKSIDEAALAMSRRSRGEPEVPPTPTPFGHAEPHDVYADDQERCSAEMTGMIGKVAGAMITASSGRGPLPGDAADDRRHRR